MIWLFKPTWCTRTQRRTKQQSFIFISRPPTGGRLSYFKYYFCTFLSRPPMNILEQFNQIWTFVFDVVGVLIDGTLFVFDNGQFVRHMHIKYGFALQLAVKKGYRVVVISGGTSDAVTDRLH